MALGRWEREGSGCSYGDGNTFHFVCINVSILGVIFNTILQDIRGKLGKEYMESVLFLTTVSASTCYLKIKKV